MSRSTQFIGLNSQAKEYVQDLEKIETDNYTLGMFDEEVKLGKWKAPKEISHVEYPTFLMESVQQAPWSSGPMIFTCLNIHIEFPTQGCCHKWNFIFEWHHDPRLKEQGLQFDYETGGMWV